MEVVGALQVTFFDLLRQTFTTSTAAATAVLIASCLAITAGSVVFLVPRLSSALIFVVIILQSFPVVALIPLLIIWLGNDWGPKIALGALFAFFPQSISVIRAMRSLDIEKIELFETMAATKLQTFFHLAVPSGLPGFFSGLRVGAPLAVVGCLVSEFAASDRGLGFYMLIAARHLETGQVFAGIVFATAMGIVAYGATLLLEHLLTPWHEMRLED
jgi:NitT/TauT family transport system permease protein